MALLVIGYEIALEEVIAVFDRININHSRV